MTIFWIIVAVVVIGLIVWYFVAGKKKGGPTFPKRPEGPTAPPPPPSPPPPGTPGM